MVEKMGITKIQQISLLLIFNMLICVVENHQKILTYSISHTCFPQGPIPSGNIFLSLVLLRIHFWKCQINLSVRTGVSIDCFYSNEGCRFFPAEVTWLASTSLP